MPVVDTASVELTARELEIGSLIAAGLPYKAIARELGISIDTVRRHASRIKKKAGLGNAVSLARAGLSLDVVVRGMRVMPGGKSLSAAELAVLAHACHGLSSKHIARMRGVSPRTVEKQREHGMAKLGIRSILQLAALVRRSLARGLRLHRARRAWSQCLQGAYPHGALLPQPGRMLRERVDRQRHLLQVAPLPTPGPPARYAPSAHASLYPPAPTAGPSAWCRPACANGPMPAPMTTPGSVPMPSTAGCITTTSTGPTPASVTSRPSPAYH